MGFAVNQNNSTLAESTSEAKKLDFDVQSQQSSLHEVDSRSRVLKSKLKSLLAKSDGSTKHPDIEEIIDELSKLNPAKKDCSHFPEFVGDFHALTSPNFPGRIEPKKGEEDLVQYTLGRLSFKIFQPEKLVCTLRGVRNPVEPCPESQNKDGPEKFQYPLILDITIHAPGGDLPAILRNEAYCYAHADINNRLMVSFTGGTLMPANEVKSDPSKLKLWADTFDGAYEKADQDRSYLGRVFQYIISLLLGLTLPSDDLKHSFHFDMKRSPVGFLDVLYLDEDLRITKGNRGTIVVVERSNVYTVSEQ